MNLLFWIVVGYFLWRKIRPFFIDRPANRRESRPPRPSALDRAYATLGCTSADSNAKIKSAYRKLVMKYHPDRLKAEGLSDALLAKATASMAEINAAWALVKSSRGIT